MEGMKRYNIFIAGGTKVTEIEATCITKAAKQFINTLERPTKYNLYSKTQASIRYEDITLLWIIML
jgi:hypothetical protein